MIYRSRPGVCTVVAMVGVAVGAMAAALTGQPAHVRLLDRRVVVPASQTALRIDPTLRVAIGPSGQLAVAEALGDFVGIIDRSGKMRRIGRRGSGPGEYRGGLSVGWLDDTLWVVDRGARRVTLLRSGQVLQARAFVGSGLRGHIIEPPFALTPAGALCPAVPDVSAKILQSGIPIPMVLTSRDGQRRPDSLFVVEQPSGPIVIQSGTWTTILEQPFAQPTQYAVSSDGRYIARVSGSPKAGSVNYGLPVATVTVYRDDGRPLYNRAIPASAGVLSASLVDSVVEAKVNEYNRASKSIHIKPPDYRRTLYRPSHVPFVTGILVSREGQVLLRGASLGVRAVTHTMLDQAGRTIGEFAVPLNQTVVAFDGDMVVSVVEDDDGAFELITQRLKR